MRFWVRFLRGGGVRAGPRAKVGIVGIAKC